MGVGNFDFREVCKERLRGSWNLEWIEMRLWLCFQVLLDSECSVFLFYYGRLKSRYHVCRYYGYWK